jgi:polysaccharide pyruvyl transferase WcaK-like protein
MPRFKKQPVIYLIGTAGHPNYGDELITAGWLKYWAKVAPEAEVWLDTPRPGPSAVLFDGLHPGLRCVDTLWHGTWNAPAADPSEIIKFGKRVIYEPGLLPREATGIENLHAVSLVHVIGGGYINRIWPQHLTLVGSANGIGERYGAKVAMTGGGLFPTPEGSNAVLGRTLNKFDVVDVRDSASFDAIRENVSFATNSGDDALLVAGPEEFDRTTPELSYVSIQSDLLEVEPAALGEFVVRTLRSWQLDDAPVVLVEYLPPGDGAIHQLLKPHLPKLRFLPFSDLWRSKLPAAPGSRWITTRFHPHLMGAAAGSWGVGILTGSDYYANKHLSLSALGSGWSLVSDLTQDIPLGAPPDSPFQGRLSDLRDRKAEVAQSVAGLLR